MLHLIHVAGSLSIAPDGLLDIKQKDVSTGDQPSVSSNYHLGAVTAWTSYSVSLSLNLFICIVSVS